MLLPLSMMESDARLSLAPGTKLFRHGGMYKVLTPVTGWLFWHWGIQKVSFQGPEDFSGIVECKKKPM